MDDKVSIYVSHLYINLSLTYAIHTCLTLCHSCDILFVKVTDGANISLSLSQEG